MSIDQTSERDTGSNEPGGFAEQVVVRMIRDWDAEKWFTADKRRWKTTELSALIRVHLRLRMSSSAVC